MFQHFIKHLCVKWHMVWVAQEVSPKGHLLQGSSVYLPLCSSQQEILVKWFNVRVQSITEIFKSKTEERIAENFFSITGFTDSTKKK